MKFKVGDKVIVTAGKDKGMTSVITQVLPKEDRVVVEGANLYVKHVQPMPLLNKPGERRRQERPLPTANIAILNHQGEPDRIGYKIKEEKQGKSKIRIFKKTKEEIDSDSKTKSGSNSKSKSKSKPKSKPKEEKTQSKKQEKTNKKGKKKES